MRSLSNGVVFDDLLMTPNPGFKVTVLCKGEYFKMARLCKCIKYIYFTSIRVMCRWHAQRCRPTSGTAEPLVEIIPQRDGPTDRQTLWYLLHLSRDKTRSQAVARIADRTARARQQTIYKLANVINSISSCFRDIGL